MKHLLSSLGLLLSGVPAFGCELALVLALDVSLSIDQEEFELQTQGTAQALLSPEVSTALLSGGGVAISLFQWSSRNQQRLILPWTFVSSQADLARAAQTIASGGRAFKSDTAPGSAIDYATGLLASNPTQCGRRVIDVSGDGVENNGIRARTASKAAVDAGITVNGLVIVGQDDRAESFYRHNVIGGPGSFLEIANGYGDYPRAIRDKLLKELPRMVAMDIPK